MVSLLRGPKSSYEIAFSTLSHYPTHGCNLKNETDDLEILFITTEVKISTNTEVLNCSIHL